MYRVSEDMFAEIAEMNQTAQQNFIKSQSEPYGPGEMGSLLRISEEIKRVARLNRSVAVVMRLQSQALINKQKKCESKRVSRLHPIQTARTPFDQTPAASPNGAPHPPGTMPA